MTNYYKEIFLYVKKTVFDRELALDITQETFSRVIKKANTNTIQNERAFLYRVAKNVMVDEFRKNSKKTEVLYDEETHIQNTDTSETSIIEEEQQKELMYEIDTLPKKRRQAFILHIIEGYSRKEVADIMGLSVSAIDKHITRASDQIKDNISKKAGNSFE